VRPVYLALIALAIILFLAISAILARALSVDGAERGAITSLVQYEARGDQDGVVSSIQACAGSATCRARVAADTASLRRAGSVTIIQIEPSAGFSLGSTLGIARVAWSAGGSLPVVQCLRVKRAGNAVSGLRVELLAITPRIESDSVCPTHF
jgi:hypothetical protein